MGILIPPRPVEFDKLFFIEVNYSRGNKDLDSSAEYFHGSEKGAELRLNAMIGSILTDRVYQDTEAAQITGDITVITDIGINLTKNNNNRRSTLGED